MYIIYTSERNKYICSHSLIYSLSVYVGKIIKKNSFFYKNIYFICINFPPGHLFRLHNLFRASRDFIKYV